MWVPNEKAYSMSPSILKATIAPYSASYAPFATCCSKNKFLAESQEQEEATNWLYQKVPSRNWHGEDLTKSAPKSFRPSYNLVWQECRSRSPLKQSTWPTLRKRLQNYCWLNESDMQAPLMLSKHLQWARSW